MESTLNPETHARIMEQWHRLILPSGPIRAGKQSTKGNSYPDAPFDEEAHLAGAATYAVNLADPASNVRCGVLDFDTGQAAAQQVAAVRAHAHVAGLATLGAVSGRKGAHCWLFVSEPVPKATMTAALRRLAELAVPGVSDFETIPGDNQRIKLPPCKHQVSGKDAYFYDAEGQPEEQAALLEAVTPTPVETLFQFVQAGANEPPASETPDDMVPDFQRLQGELPPCMKTMFEYGCLPGETFNKTALTFARYANDTRLSPSQRKQLAIRLAEDFSGNTEKDVSQRIRHIDSLKQHANEPFSCAYMLKHRNVDSFAFNCVDCAARPKGVMRDSAGAGTRQAEQPQAASKRLETELALQLLHVTLQQGKPSAVIDAAILPDGLATVWRAAGDGVTTATEMAEWCERRGHSEAAQLTSLVNKLLHLVTEPSANELAQIVERAVALTARHKAQQTLTAATHALNEGKPLDEALLAVDALAAAQPTPHWGIPLERHRSALLASLAGDSSPAIKTPFDALNSRLSGGLRGGKLYVLGAPPGSGKTTLAAQLADYAADNGTPVAFVSMEMGREQLFDYAMARHAGLNSACIEQRQLDVDDEEKLAAAAQTYLEGAGKRLAVIEGDFDTTPDRLAAWVKQARRQYQLPGTDPVLVVVDYLQLLQSGVSDLDNGSGSETLRVSQVANRLKQLARDHNAAVLALSDINREAQTDGTAGKDYTLSSYRDSNRIGHSADVALMLYSDDSKAGSSAWESFAKRLDDKGLFVVANNVRDHADDTPQHGPGALAHARLQLLKNRGGRGRGDLLLAYERAFHRFTGVSLPDLEAL